MLFSVVLNVLETEQFCPVLSAVRTRLQTSPNCKLEPGSRQDKSLFTQHFERGHNSFQICCRRHTANTDKTREDSLVLSVSAVWTRHILDWSWLSNSASILHKVFWWVKWGGNMGKRRSPFFVGRGNSVIVMFNTLSVWAYLFEFCPPLVSNC